MEVSAASIPGGWGIRRREMGTHRHPHFLGSPLGLYAPVGERARFLLRDTYSGLR